MLKITLLSAAIAFCLFTGRINACEQYFAQTPEIRFLSESDTSPAQREHLLSILGETNGLLMPIMNPPNRVNVSAKVENLNPNYHNTPILFFSGEFNRLSVGYFILNQSGSRPHRIPLRSSIPIWIHEYAHAYFHHHFRERLRSLLSDNERQQLALQLRQGEQRESELSRQLEHLSDSDPTFISVFDRWEKLQETNMAMRRQLLKPELKQLNSVHFRAYNEFFADLVAVIQTRDLRAIERSLRHDRPVSQRARRSRDFSRRQHGYWPLDADHPHPVLSRSRYETGRLLPRYWGTAKGRESFLRAVVAAIDSEITHWATTQTQPSSSREINERLMTAIRQRLQSSN